MITADNEKIKNSCRFEQLLFDFISFFILEIEHKGDDYLECVMNLHVVSGTRYKKRSDTPVASTADLTDESVPEEVGTV